MLSKFITNLFIYLLQYIKYIYIYDVIGLIAVQPPIIPVNHEPIIFFDSVTGLVLKTLGSNMAATSLKTKSAKDREEEIESSRSLEFFFYLRGSLPDL